MILQQGVKLFLFIMLIQSTVTCTTIQNCIIESGDPGNEAMYILQAEPPETSTHD